MELKKLEVPTASITDVKKSPMEVFQLAREKGTGVYIFNREKVAGVMITQEQYERLVDDLEELPMEDVSLEGEESELLQSLKNLFPGEKVTTAKWIDDHMIELGFITKKSEFGGVGNIVKELEETGKLVYQLRQRDNAVKVELIGTPDSQAALFDQLIIKRFHVPVNHD
ncbi:prevent-host-death protein [Enterococcus canis]|uniref:Prevent-host-death protein n=1 Tax=Enterococcus canis TaxID=214095 RepID=A0A1L8RJ95_9ENTE|nr:prevent-host-death protein [Enterococcus canis]OJG19840.1 prevent-host-death protein [Enterococcus canis]